MTNRQADVDMYNEKAFSGRNDSTAQFLAAVVERLPRGRALRVLDLGCGAGDLLLGLHQTRPDLSLTGLDISSVNISAARRKAAAEVDTNAVLFENADYLKIEMAPFDLILAESVLHLIIDREQHLAAKLARDLVPGGQLIATMPSNCISNRLLLLQRRIWRMLPTAADRFAIAIGKTFHAGETAELIRERVQYLRIIPERLYGRDWLAQLTNERLSLVEDSAWPRASLLKPDHRLLAFTRV